MTDPYKWHDAAELIALDNIEALKRAYPPFYVHGGGTEYDSNGNPTTMERVIRLLNNPVPFPLPPLLRLRKRPWWRRLLSRLTGWAMEGGA